MHFFYLNIPLVHCPKFFVFSLNIDSRPFKSFLPCVFEYAMISRVDAEAKTTRTLSLRTQCHLEVRPGFSSCLCCCTPLPWIKQPKAKNKIKIKSDFLVYMIKHWKGNQKHIKRKKRKQIFRYAFAFICFMKCPNIFCAKVLQKYIQFLLNDLDSDTRNKTKNYNEGITIL